MSALAPILPDRDRRRLVSAVGLLSSDKDGEVVAAARAASRLLQPHGVTVAQLVEAALTPTPWREAHRPDPVRAVDHRHLARMCLAMAALLNEWEIGFLTNLARWDGPLTAKQRAKLNAVATKIEESRP